MKVDLPTPGTPVMPTRIGLTGVRQQLAQHFLRQLPVVRPGRLHQGDGAGDSGPRAVQYAPYVPRRVIGGRAWAIAPVRAVAQGRGQRAQQLRGRVRDHGPGREDRGRTGLEQGLEVTPAG